MSKRSVRFTVYSFCFLIGCGPRVELGHKSTQDDQKKIKIYGGKQVDMGDRYRKYVVGLFNEEKQDICSGSVIAQNMILTAAHCVPEDPDNILVVPSLNFRKTKEYLSVKKIWVNPEYKKDRFDLPDIADMAILLLEKPLPDFYRPVPLFLPSQKDIFKKTFVSHAYGYGIDDLENLSGEGLLRKVSLIFSPKGTTISAQAPELGKNRLSSGEIRFVQNKQGVCYGDSGGPAFYSFRDLFIQIGVVSRGERILNSTDETHCHGLLVLTRVDAYYDWIRSILKQR